MSFHQPNSTGRPVIPIPPTVLRGPADADHYRVKVGRYGDRWYTDPLPACDIAPVMDPERTELPSVSSVKKASGGDWTFTGLKRVSQALVATPGDLTGMDQEATYERLKAVNKRGLRQAQDRGTNVHLYLERGLRGQPIEPTYADEPGAEYLPAVRDFFDTYQPDLVAAEVVCFNRDMHDVGYGGTTDGLVRIDGEVYNVDWKSRGGDSDHGCYAEEAAQLGAYASADYMIVETPAGPVRRRLPALAGGLIVSIKPDGVRLYPIDLAVAAQSWTDLHAWWCAKRNEKAAIGKPWAPRAAAGRVDYVVLATQVTTADELTALYHRAIADDGWNHMVKNAFTLRKQQLAASVAA